MDVKTKYENLKKKYNLMEDQFKSMEKRLITADEQSKSKSTQIDELYGQIDGMTTYFTELETEREK